jgi:hypothetical protein
VSDVLEYPLSVFRGFSLAVDKQSRVHQASQLVLQRVSQAEEKTFQKFYKELRGGE